MSAFPSSPSGNAMPASATAMIPDPDSAPGTVRGVITFPKRLDERATRGVRAMAARIGRMTVEEARLLQSRVDARWPSLPVRVRLCYRGSSFGSIRYALSSSRDFGPGCWIGLFDEPDVIAGDLLHAARTEHAGRMIVRRCGPDPMLAASDEEVIRTVGPPKCMRDAEEAAWRAVAGREARLRYRESAHRQISRQAAARLRKDR